MEGREARGEGVTLGEGEQWREEGSPTSGNGSISSSYSSGMWSKDVEECVGECLGRDEEEEAAGREEGREGEKDAQRRECTEREGREEGEKDAQRGRGERGRCTLDILYMCTVEMTCTRYARDYITS